MGHLRDGSLLVILGPTANGRLPTPFQPETYSGSMATLPSGKNVLALFENERAESLQPHASSRLDYSHLLSCIAANVSGKLSCVPVAFKARNARFVDTLCDTPPRWNVTFGVDVYGFNLQSRETEIAVFSVVYDV